MPGTAVAVVRSVGGDVAVGVAVLVGVLVAVSVAVLVAVAVAVAPVAVRVGVAVRTAITPVEVGRPARVVVAQVGVGAGQSRGGDAAGIAVKVVAAIGHHGRAAGYADRLQFVRRVRHVLV